MSELSCQSLSAMSSLNVNDILEELLNENSRLLNELLFAHKCITKSFEFKNFIDSIAKEFVDNLNPDMKKKYEELSLGLNHLIDRKWINISDNSLNYSKTATKLDSSDHSIETDSDYHTANEDNVSDEEEYIIKELVKEFDVMQASETGNNKSKHICNRCGNTYDFPEVFELHIQYCGSERQTVSSESLPKYNWNDIEEEEKEMVSEELVRENMVTIDEHNNYEGGDEEAFTEDFLVDKPVTEKVSVRTENIFHKRMTRSSTKAVSEQQLAHSSGEFNHSAKPSAKRKSEPNSRGNKKLFLFKCDFNGCNAVFRKRKARTAHKKKLHRWKCDFPGCDYQTEIKCRMNLHLRRHSNDRPYECDHCDKNYKHNEALIEHMKTKHLDQCPNDPILVCDWNECHFRTKSLRAMNVHKGVHTLPFKCRKCKQRFSVKCNMKTHLMSKHKKKCKN